MEIDATPLPPVREVRKRYEPVYRRAAGVLGDARETTVSRTPTAATTASAVEGAGSLKVESEAVEELKEETEPKSRHTVSVESISSPLESPSVRQLRPCVERDGMEAAPSMRAEEMVLPADVPHSADSVVQNLTRHFRSATRANLQKRLWLASQHAARTATAVSSVTRKPATEDDATAFITNLTSSPPVSRPLSSPGNDSPMSPVESTSSRTPPGTFVATRVRQLSTPKKSPRVSPVVFGTTAECIWREPSYLSRRATPGLTGVSATPPSKSTPTVSPTSLTRFPPLEFEKGSSGGPAKVQATPGSNVSDRSGIRPINLSPLFAAGLKMSGSMAGGTKLDAPLPSPPRLVRETSSRQSTPSSMNPFSQLSDEEDSFDSDEEEEEGPNDDDTVAALAPWLAPEWRREVRDEEENENGWSSDDASPKSEERTTRRYSANGQVLSGTKRNSTYFTLKIQSDSLASTAIPLFPRKEESESAQGWDQMHGVAMGLIHETVPASAAPSKSDLIQRSTSAFMAQINTERQNETAVGPVDSTGLVMQSSIYFSSSHSRSVPVYAPMLDTLSDREGSSESDDDCRDPHTMFMRALGDDLTEAPFDHGEKKEEHQTNDESKVGGSRSPLRSPTQSAPKLCKLEDRVPTTPMGSTPRQKDDEQPLVEQVAPVGGHRRHMGWFLGRRRLPRIMKRQKSKPSQRSDPSNGRSSTMPNFRPIFSCMTPESTVATEDEVETVLLERLDNG